MGRVGRGTLETDRTSRMRLDENSRYEGVKTERQGFYHRGVVPGHPLGDSRSRVYLHRAVLYDAIGAGPHRCHWCQWDGLNWGLNGKDPDNLIVDHLDGDADNNRRENLVCAHKWCNDNRATIERHGIDWAAFADVAPADRPALRQTNSGHPTKAALELAGGAPLEVPEPDPTAPAGAGREVREGFVAWADLVDIAALGGGQVRLLPPPADLVALYPQLHRLDA